MLQFDNVIYNYLCVGFFVYFFLIYLFYFCLRWVFVAARGLSLVAASGGYSSLWCVGFSLQWLLLLRNTALGVRASVVVAHGLSSCGSWALERRLSSCGARSQLLCGMWDLPGPGFGPVSLALAGGFLTTVPPGKSLCVGFYYSLSQENFQMIHQIGIVCIITFFFFCF